MIAEYDNVVELNIRSKETGLVTRDGQRTSEYLWKVSVNLRGWDVAIQHECKPETEGKSGPPLISR